MKNKTLPLSEDFIESKEKCEGVGLMLRGRDARGSVGGLLARVDRTRDGEEEEAEEEVEEEEEWGWRRQESRRLVGNVA